MEGPESEKPSGNERLENPVDPETVDWDLLLQAMRIGKTAKTQAEAAIEILRDNSNQPTVGHELFKTHASRGQPHHGVNRILAELPTTYRLAMIEASGVSYMDATYALVERESEVQLTQREQLREYIVTHEAATDSQEEITGNLTTEEWELLENELENTKTAIQYVQRLKANENQSMRAEDLFGTTSIVRLNAILTNFDKTVQGKLLPFRLQRREVVRSEPAGERKYALQRLTGSRERKRTEGRGSESADADRHQFTETEEQTGNLTKKEWTALVRAVEGNPGLQLCVSRLQENNNEPVHAAELFDQLGAQANEVISRRLNAWLIKHKVPFRLRRRNVVRGQEKADQQFALNRYHITETEGESEDE